MAMRHAWWAFPALAWLAAWGLAGEPPAEPGKAAAQDEFALRLPRGLDVFGWKVDLSGEARLRGEHWDDVDLDESADDTDGRFFLRTRVKTHVKFSEWASAVVHLADVREWESDRPGRPHNDELDLYEGYVQFDGLLGAPLFLRLGRQGIDLGSRRLVAESRWSSVGRSFDAARLSYIGDAAEVHGFLGSVVVNQDDHFNEHRHGEAFFGILSTLKLCPGHKLDLYALGLLARRDEVTGEDGGSGDHERSTLGTRLFGSLAERWTYDVELACQHGRYAHDRIRAWAIHADTAYTLDLPWRPTIQPLINLATGDRDPTDGRRNTFDPLFSGLGHGEYGIIDFLHWMNMREIGAVLKLNPLERLTLSFEAHRYWLDEDKDAWYTSSKRPKRRDTTGRSGDSVGHELSFVAKYELSRQVTLEGGWARFFPGEFPRNTGPDDNADFGYLQSVFRF